ncbi:unnamed protein product, partial [Mesorhabditis spiculigera]
MQPTPDRLGERGPIIENLFNVTLVPGSFIGAQYWDPIHGLRWLDLFGAFGVSSVAGGAFNLEVFLTYRLPRPKRVECSSLGPTSFKTIPELHRKGSDKSNNVTVEFPDADSFNK